MADTDDDGDGDHDEDGIPDSERAEGDVDRDEDGDGEDVGAAADDVADDPDDSGGDTDAGGDGDEASTVREWLNGKRLNKSGHIFLGFVVPAMIALVNMIRVWSFTVDDSYISYRYARNVSRGWGLVYNHGERIEGYTNFLWTMILGGAVSLGLDPDTAAKVLGAGCAVASLACMFLIESRIRKLDVMPVVSTWLMASTLVFAGYAVWGLETSLFVLLILSGTLLMMREEDGPVDAHARWYKLVPWSGLVFGFAGLTRPEAPMYLGLLMFFLPGKSLWRFKRLTPWPEAEGGGPVVLCSIAAMIGLLGVRFFVKDLTPLMVKGIHGGLALGALFVVAHLPRSILARRNLLRGALFVAPVAVHLLWRHSYYGRWLPNTLGAKTGDMKQQLAGGFDYVEKFVAHGGSILHFVLFGMAAALAWRHRTLLAFCAITALGTFYVVLVGGDWMPIYRFMGPVQPFAFLLIGIAMRALIEQRSRLLNYGLLMLALVTVGQRAHRLNTDRQTVLGQEKKFWDRAAGGTVRWFKEQEQQRGAEQVYGQIALGDIGYIGYQTDYPILDLLGLVDPVVSNLPGGYTRKIGKGYTSHFFDSKPRYFILISAQNDCHHPSVPGSQVLYRDRRFLQEYFVSGRIRLDKGFSWCIYERKDVPNANTPLRGEQRQGKPQVRPGMLKR